MATSVYGRLRFLWDAVDITFRASDSSYSPAETGTSLGPSAVAGAGVGVRRAALICDRTAAIAGADPVETHIDFLNLTGGEPDDTWITSDYTACEALISAFLTSMKPHLYPTYKWTEIAWYRHGYGIVAPNPAERLTTISIVGTGSSGQSPPQISNTLTLRTGARRHWGRLYWPAVESGEMNVDGQMNSTSVDAWCGILNTLVTNAFSAEYPVVVTSLTDPGVFNVEHVEVDSNIDIQRRRRWKQADYRKILP